MRSTPASPSPGSCSRRWTAMRGAVPPSASVPPPPCRSPSSGRASGPMASSRSTPTALPSGSSAWATSSPSSSGSRRTSTGGRPERAAERLMANRFTLEDFREQINQIKKMGPIGQLVRHDPRCRADGRRRPGGRRLRPDEAPRGDHRLDATRAHFVPSSSRPAGGAASPSAAGRRRPRSIGSSSSSPRCRR